MSDQQKTKDELIKELQLNRKALKITQEVAKIGYWELDLSTYHLHWSDENYKIFDIDKDTPPEELFSCYRNKLDPVDQNKLDLLIDHLKGTGNGFSIEHSIITSQGTRKQIKGIAKTVKDANSNIVAIQGTFQDITKDQAQENRQIDQKSMLLELPYTHQKGPTEVLDGITRLSSKALKVERVGIWDLINNDQGIRCLSLFQQGNGDHERGKVLTAKDHPRYFMALSKGNPITANDAYLDPRTEELSDDHLKPNGINSVLQVIIKEAGREKKLGIISFEHTGTAKKWTKEEQQLALSIADIASLAFESYERKRKEDRLRLQSTMLNAVGQAVIATDLEGKVTYLNKAAEEMYGWPESEMIGQNIMELTVPKTSDIQAKQIMDALSANQNWSGEFMVQNRDGKTFPALVNNSPIIDDKNKLIGVVGVSMDIKERKQTEEMLTKLTSNFAHLTGKDFFDAVCRDAAKVIGLDHVFVGKFNPGKHSVSTLGGYAKGEPMDPFTYDLEHTPCENVIGKRLCVYPNNIRRTFPKDHLLNELGAESYIGIPLFSKDNKALGIMVGLHGSPLINIDKTESFFSIYIDRVSAEMQRTKSEDELNRLSEMQAIILKMALKYINIPYEHVHRSINTSLKELGEFVQADRVYVFDYDWENNVFTNTFEWCNDGITPEIENLQNVPNEVLGHWLDVHKKGNDMYIEDVKDLPADGPLRQMLLSQDIKSLLAIPMMKQEECIGFIGFDSVKTKRKFSDKEKTLLKFFSEMLVNAGSKEELERRLIQAKEKAEESDRLKSAFLANMSHEIRTPMNAILGFTRLLKRIDLSEEKKEEYFKLIETESDNLLNLITDIIDVSKIDANQLTIKNEACNVNKLIDRLQEKFNLLNEDPDHAIISRKGLSDEQSVISTDATRLSQILSNLLENARKFNNDGNIELGYILKNNMLEFYVKDNGIGIDKKLHKSIFDRFRQADGHYTRSISGTGLGLAIVKNLTELLGGKVWVESEINKGATFRFTIPYIQREETVKKTNMSYEE